MRVLFLALRGYLWSYSISLIALSIKHCCLSEVSRYKSTVKRYFQRIYQ